MDFEKFELKLFSWVENKSEDISDIQSQERITALVIQGREIGELNKFCNNLTLWEKLDLTQAGKFETNEFKNLSMLKNLEKLILSFSYGIVTDEKKLKFNDRMLLLQSDLI